MQLDQHPAGRRAISHRDLLAIAVPIVLSNATTPLIGFADTVVAGRLGQAHLIGAVAVAANIFNTLYWTFGFLRMGTTGLTAQAVGARNESEVAANLMRALLIAGTGGVAMIALQSLIAYLAFLAMGASPEVEQAATRRKALPARECIDCRVSWPCRSKRTISGFEGSSRARSAKISASF